MRGVVVIAADTAVTAQYHIRFGKDPLKILFIHSAERRPGGIACGKKSYNSLFSGASHLIADLNHAHTVELLMLSKR